MTAEDTSPRRPEGAAADTPPPASEAGTGRTRPRRNQQGAGGEPAQQPRGAMVGTALKRKREEYGLALEDVASVLRIKASHLAAIEEGRPDRLPVGEAYVVGFVRTYAAYLQLPAETYARRFKAEAAGLTERPQLDFPDPAREVQIPVGAILIVSTILAAIGYAGWYVFQQTDRSLIERVESPPPRLVETPSILMPATGFAPVATALRPVVLPAAPPTSPSIGASAPLPGASLPGMAPAGEAEIPVAADGPPPPPVPAVAQVPGRAVGGDPTHARVALRAVEDTWIELRGGAGQLLFQTVLRAGEVYHVPLDQPGTTLTNVGNAAGLDILVDGQALPRLGNRGEVVRRRILLEPQALIGR